MDIKKVGVVGFGIMGSGITQVCAQSGYQVVVSEVSEALLDKGMKSIDSRLSRDVEKERIKAEDKDSALGRIQGITDMEEFSDCDLVIEAVIENLDEKKKVFTELDKVCPEHTVLASNTSVMSIIDIATATNRMEKVLGLHFMTPATITKLLEIVQTIATSDETLETGKEFGKSIGKTILVAKDTPGFVLNRLSTPFYLNSIRMLESGIATREDIDNAATMGLNHPIGPLALVDFIGVDTFYYAACDMYAKLNEPQYAPPVLLQKMVSAGWYGRKVGKGFYDYK